MPVRIALSIAGSDPSGGAGLQADLQVFRVLGVHGAAVPTALTVQDSAKVFQVLPVFPSAVLDQIRALARDLPLAAVKLGMLATDDVARAVAYGLDELARAEPRPPLVVDPVLEASDGSPLLERRAIPALLEIVGRAVLVTPNLLEAERLTSHDVSTQQGVEAAARSLVDEIGAGAALVTGGHRDGPPDDLLALRRDGAVALHWLPGQRLDVGPVHGTGCALAAACAAGLALGHPLEDAVVRARDFVHAAIAKSEPAGAGARLLVF